MDVEVGDSMPDGWQLWLNWHKVIAPDNRSEIEALEADRGKIPGLSVHPLASLSRRRCDLCDLEVRNSGNSRLRDLGENVLYCSLTGMATPECCMLAIEIRRLQGLPPTDEVESYQERLP